MPFLTISDAAVCTYTGIWPLGYHRDSTRSSCLQPYPSHHHLCACVSWSSQDSLITVGFNYIAPYETRRPAWISLHGQTGLARAFLTIAGFSLSSPPPTAPLSPPQDNTIKIIQVNILPLLVNIVDLPIALTHHLVLCSRWCFAVLQ